MTVVARALKGPSAVALLLACLIAAACSREPVVAAPCARDLDCPEGQGCLALVCSVCPTCQGDDTCVGGRCVPRRCGDVPCPEGEGCVDGRCVSRSCAGVSCSAGQACAKGKCYPEDCGSDDCLASGVCAGQACTRSDCVGVACPAGKVCAAGSCLDEDCAGVVCGGGTACEAGSCVSMRCVGVICPGGTLCSAGRCAPVACVDACAAGQVCADDACVDKDCVGVACPQATRCERGTCVACEAFEVACAGGRDEDCDGDADCADPDCAQAGECLCRHEASEALCGDGVDDDCDAKTDCEDEECAGSPCDDGDRCTSGDTCEGASCAGEAKACDAPPGACWKVPGSCRSATGACQYPPAAQGAVCDDQNRCTDGDACDGNGTCGGGAKDCDDHNPCTADGCDPATGCTHTPVADGAVCGASGYTDWSGCSYADDCAESGTQTRTRTDHACKAGRCEPSQAAETQGCTRDTDGQWCGGSWCDGWGECAYLDACISNGSQTRTCYEQRCSNGACGTRSLLQTVGCTRSVPNGTACGSELSCCGGSCVWMGDPAHCNNCAISCGGYACVKNPKGVYQCRCAGFMDCRNGGNGPAATCYDAGDGYGWLCNCQCGGSPCLGQCADGATCQDEAGHNYCRY